MPSSLPSSGRWCGSLAVAPGLYGCRTALWSGHQGTWLGPLWSLPWGHVNLGQADQGKPLPEMSMGFGVMTQGLVTILSGPLGQS